ncbi:FadR family transcriptional regulator [Rhodocaloribacter litoris]|uniref:FadR/GntR family transcriptional regulator n=1 Tax=Rhodocaloribacter litoris TaxID=2558931 RepID=UPI001423CC72|nr:FadR/GntR family transcriptional regulator [Rhodocaloribacter litoris]QXD15090.1 FadR family transcriptional regulator [Rhodocaloribacter litoris]GIV62119.1 MAG: GntR family transcriptional regulator [Rhodothermaceae bacterium]
MKHRIKPIPTHSLVDLVEIQLMDFLASNEVKVGDVLPKETELADAFGVSRTVVREALTRLKVRGLIESNKRKGSVVTHPDVLTNIERVLQPQILDQETLKDLFELRLVLEVGMADLVFSRLQQKDLRELEEIVKDEPEGGSAFLFDIEFEARFHGKLYEISGNRTLQRFQTLLLPIFGYVHDKALQARHDPTRPFISHRGLVDILRSGTPDEYRRAMRLHLDNHFRRVLENQLDLDHANGESSDHDS